MTFLHAAISAAFLAVLVSPADAQSRPFASAGGWDTIAEFDGGRFLGCGSSRAGGPGFMGLAQDASGGWIMALGLPRVTGPLRAVFEVDGVALPERAASADGYSAHVPLSADDRATLARGARVRVVVRDHADGAWTLAGAAAAIAAIDRCVAARGR